MREIEFLLDATTLDWANQHNLIVNDLPQETSAMEKRMEKIKNSPRTSDTSKLANDYRISVMNFNQSIKKFSPSDESLAQIEFIYSQIKNLELVFPSKINQLYLSKWDYKSVPSSIVKTHSVDELFSSIEKQRKYWYELMHVQNQIAPLCHQAIVLLYRISLRLQQDFLS